MPLGLLVQVASGTLASLLPIGQSVKSQTTGSDVNAGSKEKQPVSGAASS
jgi:hypothetical protein